MNESIKICLPKLGESIHSATVVQWFKKVGDQVELDEPLLEVSTDKVNSEIPSPVAGVLEAILTLPDVEVQVGETLALVRVEGSASVSERKETISYECPSKAASSEKDSFLSPAVLRLLQENGVSFQEIENIPRTGENGRLSKKDVERYLEKKRQGSSFAPSSDTERVKMSPMRKAIAENMVRSFYEAPHASLFTEVNVSKVVEKIEKEKGAFLKTHGFKLSITAFAARAIARALKEFPHLNASLEGDTIVVKKSVNLGIAVSVDQAVMVPVIRKANELSLADIAKEVASLAEKARGQKLSPQDVKDGTITMTNFGMTGTMIGVPIIRYPEVAIVGLGAITKKVVPLESGEIGVISSMWVSLTFDHRVLDGLYGCGFLNALKKHFEEDVSLD